MSYLKINLLARLVVYFLLLAMVMVVLVGAMAFLRAKSALRVLYEDLDQEITERKHIELALRDSEERYRTFVAQRTDGICRSDVEHPFSIDLPEDQQVDHLLRYGYLAECNDAYAQMYGYEKRVIIYY